MQLQHFAGGILNRDEVVDISHERI
jgi:hypothetical protein